ncbi:MAG TPA: hypothetical protein VMY38_01705 [Gemmatimonadaceae bacterium]|nr:hypothetical protein [Gemmatimonadaceae bacterium]
MRNARAIFVFTIALFCGACAVATRESAPGAPTPEAWGAVLNTADMFANAGRHAAADSALLAFARANPGTRAAEEVAFWRALYKLDPRSSASTRAEGRTMMESYAASSTTSWYKGQANVLRFLAREIADAEQSGSDSTIVAGDTTSGGLAARDRVIRTQRAEIARLNAELERIKRRLASPTP